MKKMILSLILMTSMRIFGQTISDVIQTDSTLTKANLYSNALSFFATEFKSANDVIQMKDAETGKVIGKGMIDGKSITIGISCKNGKYKYDITLDKINKPIQVPFKTTFSTINGETYGFINYNDSNKLIIRSIAFISNSPKDEYVEYSDIEGNLLPYKGKRTEEYASFKANVELELKELYPKYLELILEKDKKIITKIISDLKREMVKKSDW